MVSWEMGNIVTSFLVSLGLAFVISLSLRPLSRLDGYRYQFALGAMFGLAAILSIVFGGFPIGPGLLGDMRNVLVVLSGVFSGPVGGTVATVMTALFRLTMDGNPAGGVIAITGCGIIGIIVGRRWRFRLTEITWRQFLLVGVAITLINLLVPAIAVPAGWLDIGKYWELAKAVAPPMAVTYSVGTILVGITVRIVLSGIAADRDVLAAKIDAEKASRAKTEFLAGMSHELRTPMNAVLGFAQMLQMDAEKTLSKRHKGYVENILDGGNHLLELINEVLDLSRIEAKQAIFQTGSVSIRDAVRHSLDLLSLEITGRKIVVQDHTLKAPDIIVQADDRRVRQILLNILGNAVKYNDRGGSVVIDAVATETGMCRVTVADSGIGIAEDERPNMFKIFHRLETQSMTSREGNGVGMAVTRMLVEQMAGRIDYDSEIGVGTTFWFELPLATDMQK